MRVGLGFDVHGFAGESESRPLVLGGVEIDGPGLVGHSDADVVVHAVADSLLAAAGLDDLGTLFPADDDAWHDADSMALLAQVVELLRERGLRVSNASVVVAAERPRLAPYVVAMRERVSQVLAGAGGQPHVSVSPKRAEGVGAVGRGEGIAAWSVALVVDDSE